jgi:hypothetical protein
VPWPSIQVDDLLEYLDASAQRSNPQMLSRMLSAAEEAVEQYTGRRFTPDPPLASDGQDTAAPVTKAFNTNGRWMIRIPDLRYSATTVVTLDGSSIVHNEGYQLEPDDAREPATHMYLAEQSNVSAQGEVVAITGRWGWNPTPEAIIDAVLVIASRKVRMRQASYADQVVTAEGLTFAYFRMLPADVKAVLDFYRVPKVALVGPQSAEVML